MITPQSPIAPLGFNRRTFIAAALAAGGGGVLAAIGGQGGAAAATIDAATRVKAAGSDLGAIEHVIFFMQENRSFDHYYGSYKGVRGFDDHAKHSLGAFAQTWPGGAAERLLPFHLQADSGIGECTHDLSHTWPAEHMSRGTGLNADFVRTHTSATFEGPQEGVLTMGYYTRADLPFYYALADAFTICDNYHCSVMGPTHPNRLMALSGTIDPGGKAGGPVIITNEDTDAIWSVDWPTMPEVLEDAGISWKVYNPEGALYTPSFFEQHGLLAGDAILPYFSQYKNPNSTLYKKAFLPQYPSDFVADGLGHRFEIAVGGEIGVDDPIDAGFRRGTRGAGAARVNADAQVAPVRLGDDGGNLLLRQHLRFTGAAVRHLDEIDAVLALPAYLGDHFVGAVAELADGVVGRSFPRRLVVLDAAIGDDHAARDIHARPFHQAELDGVAHAYVGEPGAARN